VKAAKHQGLPLFVCDQARANETYPDELIVSFHCSCGRRHEHGWIRDEDRSKPQHRVQHCGSRANPSGYYIVVAADAGSKR